MTILHILDELNRGGAETLVLDLCRNAKKNGLSIILVSLRGGDLEEDFRKTGIEFIKLNREKPFDLKTIIQLRKILKQKKVTIIHTHLMIATLHAYIASMGLKAKRIMTHHGIKPNDRRIKDRLSASFLVPRMSINIAVSKTFLKRLEQEIGYNTQNFCVIYNGIDSSKFKIENKARGEKITMGMVANFVKSKDQLIVCKALLSVFSRFPNSRFVFVGAKTINDAPYFDECLDFCVRNNIQDKVIFTGKRKDISEILGSLDLFVFSSLNESFGIAVVEAMLCGIPVILSDISAMLEISDNGKYAKIFEKGNPKDLSQKIEQSLCDMDRANKLAVGAKTWAEDNFTIEKHIKELVHLYRNIVQEWNQTS